MIVARFGEIFLKSDKVKKRFLSQLINNIKTAVDEEVTRKRLRIYIYPENEEKTLKELKKVFGLVSISPAKETKPKLDEIKKIAKQKTSEWEGTYSVRAKRITKDYPFTSKDAEEEIGATIQQETGLEVDLDNPDNTLYIEFYEDKAHIFTEKIKTPGGLPLGVSGTLEAEITSKEDLTACWMMMKRGCLIKLQKTNPELKKTFKKWNLTPKKPSEPQGKITGTTEIDQFTQENKETEKPLYAPLLGLKEGEISDLETKIFH